MSWFSGDWPLQNHFYRPVSTLAFELDNRLYGNNAAGYGWTNVLLCASCVLLLFWFVRELTDSAWLSGCSSVLFAFWNLGEVPYASVVFTVWAWALFVFGAIRHRRRWLAYIPPYFALFSVASELAGKASLRGRMIEWLPGRTASVMTVFALISLAAYARFERLGARLKKVDAAPSPLDPPATRSTRQTQRKPKNAWPYAVLSLAAAALALGSYEQAVMLPATLLGVALIMRFQGYRVRWGWQGAFWCVLAGYIMVRHALVPSAPSQYQLQQFRKGPGVFLDIASYVLPVAGSAIALKALIDGSFQFLYNAQFWNILLEGASNVSTFFLVRRRWIFGLAGYALSAVAFLPMAWVKQFQHYHYWPMALRSILAVVLVQVLVERSITAWSPQARQAPLRPSPAPGSLPRP